MINPVILMGAILVFFVILIIRTYSKEKGNERINDNECLIKLQKQEIHLDDYVKTTFGIIGIDQSKKKLIITQTNPRTIPEYYILAYEDLYRCELIKNNEVLLQKSTTRTMGGAIIGGIIGGKTGAIIGGLSGDYNSENKTNIIELKIVVKDISHPTHIVTFFDTNIHLPGEFKQLANEAEKWYDRVCLIIDQIDSETQKQPNLQISTNSSLADELMKLHELMKNGILTEDEFNMQKKKLLNL
ncbi:SHOCT domain-containing protein [Bacteroides thetaiotaomicron]|uniref:SHOCT domain-containing protein n=1 Tax=Bacteroides thetaiotaomicron TaxID=818 RepID=A0A174NB34_BACT4|nr:SHOCT domain-containing protein [Bacteroides thetaiotaomicron]CUP44077.1 Uncharacterised protein [Bacteroides thetaiotaomicron]